MRYHQVQCSRQVLVSTNYWNLLCEHSTPPRIVLGRAVARVGVGNKRGFYNVSQVGSKFLCRRSDYMKNVRRPVLRRGLTNQSISATSEL
jgi:hypothetical protein